MLPMLPDCNAQMLHFANAICENEEHGPVVRIFCESLIARLQQVSMDRHHKEPPLTDSGCRKSGLARES